WLGSAPISARRHLTAGTETELRSHLRSQPLTAFRRLEELLIRSGVQPQSAVRAAFDGVNPDNVEDLVELLTSVLSMGRATATMNLDWSPLIPSLTKFRGDVEPLLWAIGNSDPSLPIMSFCGTLGMPQWRSLSRTDSAVAEHITRRLWAKCPPIALICDSSRIRSSEPVRTACAGYLGADSIASFRSGDMRRMGGYIAAKDFQPTRGAVARLRGLLSSLSAPILSPEGWELACMRGLERITNSADLQREALSVVQTCAPNVAQARSAIHGVLGWDVLQDRPSNAGQFPTAFLLTVSLAVAYSQRLLARQTHVRGELFPERKLESAVSLLSRALPEVYTHDLCVAELAVAGATR
ncbi:MAG: hypothetical protein LC118_13155, partial [Dehalococcoidia bacterium]|nr:hypothetical protein [Dehalococcoidia bacterium]